MKKGTTKALTKILKGIQNLIRRNNLSGESILITVNAIGMYLSGLNVPYEGYIKDVINYIDSQLKKYKTEERERIRTNLMIICSDMM